MNAVRLIYFSENRLDTTSRSLLSDLKEILSASSRNNARDGLTGALIFDDMWFFQALEGPREMVWARFNKIMRDPRHSGVMLVESTPIATRRFDAWSMRLARRGPKTQHLFDTFTRGNLLRPELMSGRHILEALIASTQGNDVAATKGDAIAC